MEPGVEIEAVLAHYSVGVGSQQVRQIEATHRAFRVEVDGKPYALRQFNPYMACEDLATQLLLAHAMAEAGLSTPVPVPTDDRKPFVQLACRLWALFPWCDGRPGDPERFEDLMALVEAEAKWATCCGPVEHSPHWDAIVGTAKRLRRRKDWAWIVPLDQLPHFAQEIAIPKVSDELPRGSTAGKLGEALPGLLWAAAVLQELLVDQSVGELPHMVTHGDFWASNIVISGEGTHVLDLDCFSYEPRVADFARSAHWYHAERTPHENSRLMSRFRILTGLRDEEVQILPALIYAHDL